MAAKLFSNKLCPYVQRAAIAAIEKAVPVETVDVSLSDMPAWYKELNPRETLPSLQLPNKKMIFESMILVQYFDEVGAKDVLLYPADPALRAEMRFFLDECGNLIGTLYQTFRTKEEDLAEKKKELGVALAKVEALLTRGGPYFFGPTFTAADIAIVPFLIRFRHTLPHYRGIDIFATAPKLRALAESALLRPSVAQTTEPGQFYIDAYVSYSPKTSATLEKPTLYVQDGCPYCARVLLAAKVKGADIAIEVLPREIPAWYAKDVNPRGTVPTLKVHGRFVYESTIIVEYLDEAFPAAHKLLPTDPVKRADVRFYADECNNLVGAFFELLFTDPAKADEAAALQKQVLEVAAKVEALIKASSSGPYFLGSEISEGDVLVIPFLYRAYYQLPALSNFDLFAHAPVLKRLIETAKADPAYASTFLAPETVIANAERLTGRTAKKHHA